MFSIYETSDNIIICLVRLVDVMKATPSGKDEVLFLSRMKFEVGSKILAIGIATELFGYFKIIKTRATADDFRGIFHVCFYWFGMRIGKKRERM